jgi:carbon monoxide dehydrogenase subunit G
MQFAGEKEFPLPAKAVFAKLSDARFLVECIPGRESTDEAGPQRAVVTQRPGFAFMRGTIHLTIEILDAVPDSTVKYALLGKGIGSASYVESLVTLTPKSAGTHVGWQAQVKSLGGLLKAVPSGLIQGAAQKIIADVWQEVEKRLT